MKPGFGTRLGLRLDSGETLAFIGVYDMLSATAAARQFDGLLVSPSAFAASHYGITDVGFMAWSEIATFVRRLRALLPSQHIVVDLDNGCGDTDVLCHAASLLEKAGASGVILGDRERAARGEAAEGVMSLEAFSARLARVLKGRKDLFVVARTTGADIATIAERIPAFTDAGADAVLADHAGSLGSITMLASTAGRFAVAQNDADDTPSYTLGELGRAGVAIAIYANPCFAAAEKALREAVESLTASDGLMSDAPAMEGSSYAVALAARATQRSRTPRSYPWSAPGHVSAR